MWDGTAHWGCALGGPGLREAEEVREPRPELGTVTSELEPSEGDGRPLLEPSGDNEQCRHWVGRDDAVDRSRCLRLCIGPIRDPGVERVGSRDLDAVGRL